LTKGIRVTIRASKKKTVRQRISAMREKESENRQEK